MLAAAAARRLPWGAAHSPAVAAAVGRNASKQDLGKESLLRRLPAEHWADAAATPPPPRRRRAACLH